MDRTCSKKCQRIATMDTEKRQSYYKKHKDTRTAGFSKSLKAREKFSKKSPWQQLKNIFS